METLVVKLLQKYFQLFITNFHKDNFSLSVLKGTGSLTNLQLNTQVLQELLGIPTTMEVQSAYCNQLEVQIQLTKMKSEPITITLDKVAVVLTEPKEVKSPTNFLEQFRSKGSSVAQFDLLLDLKLVIKEITVSVSTLPSPQRPQWTPSVILNIKDVVLQSTNGKWEVAELTKCKEIDPQDQSVTLLYKVMSIRSIFLEATLDKDMKLVLLDNIPLTVQFMSRWKLKEVQWISGNVEVILEDFGFKATKLQLERIAEFAELLKNCFSRVVPPRKGDAELPMSPLMDDEPNNNNAGTGSAVSPDVAFSIKVERWAVKITDGNSGSGFEIQGPGLAIAFSRKELPSKNPLENIYQSFVSFTLPSIGVTQYLPPPKSASVIIYHDVQSSKEFSNLIDFRVDWKEKVLHPENASVVETDLLNLAFKVKVYGLAFYLDSEELGIMYEFLQSIFKWPDLAQLRATLPPSTTPTPTPTQQEGGASRWQKEMEAQMKKLNDWNVVSYSLESQKIKVIFPIGNSEGQEVVVTLDKVLSTNRPSWSHVPLLHDKSVFWIPPKDFKHSVHPPPSKALPPSPTTPTPTPTSTLPTPTLPTPTPTTPVTPTGQTGEGRSEYYKYHVMADGLVIKVNEPKTKTEHVIFKATGLEFNGRYLLPENGGLSTHTTHNEVTVDSQDLYVSASDHQIFSFYKLGRQWQTMVEKYAGKLITAADLSGKMTSQLKAKLSSELSGMSVESAVSKVGALADSVKEALDNLKLIVYVRSKKGEFVMPTSLLVKFGDFEEVLNKKLSVSEEHTLLMKDSVSSHVKYQGLHLGVENASKAQKAVFRLKGMEVSLDHPQSSIHFQLIPKGFFDMKVVKLMNINTEPFENLQFIFNRYPHPDSLSNPNLHISDAFIRLQEMKIVLGPKPVSESQTDSGASSLLSGASMPDLQGLFEKMVSSFEQQRGKIEAAIGHFQQHASSAASSLKDKFTLDDLHWDFEMGDCEVTHLFSKNDPSKARGVFKVNSNPMLLRQVEEKFLEMEALYVESKSNNSMLTAQLETETDRLKKLVRELEEKSKILEKDREVAERKCIEATIKVAELQVVNNELEETVLAYKRSTK